MHTYTFEWLICGRRGKIKCFIHFTLRKHFYVCEYRTLKYQQKYKEIERQSVVNSRLLQMIHIQRIEEFIWIGNMYCFYFTIRCIHKLNSELNTNREIFMWWFFLFILFNSFESFCLEFGIHIFSLSLHGILLFLHFTILQILLILNVFEMHSVTKHYKSIRSTFNQAKKKSLFPNFFHFQYIISKSVAKWLTKYSHWRLFSQTNSLSFVHSSTFAALVSINFRTWIYF